MTIEVKLYFMKNMYLHDVSINTFYQHGFIGFIYECANMDLYKKK